MESSKEDEIFSVINWDCFPLENDVPQPQKLSSRELNRILLQLLEGTCRPQISNLNGEQCMVKHELQLQE